MIDRRRVGVCLDVCLYVQDGGVKESGCLCASLSGHFWKGGAKAEVACKGGSLMGESRGPSVRVRRKQGGVGVVRVSPATLSLTSS